MIYLGGSSVITKVLIRGSQEGQRKGKVVMTEALRERLEKATLLALKWRMGPGAMGCRQIPQARKGKGWLLPYSLQKEHSLANLF